MRNILMPWLLAASLAPLSAHAIMGFANKPGEQAPIEPG